MTNMLAASLSEFPVNQLAAWAAILSGLAVLGIVWVGHNMYKLARNQVKLGLMLEELLRR